MIRAAAVTLLLIDAVWYAAQIGVKPALAWLALAVVTAKFLPSEA